MRVNKEPVRVPAALVGLVKNTSEKRFYHCTGCRRFILQPGMEHRVQVIVTLTTKMHT